MKVFKDAPTKIELIKATKLLENQCECSPLVQAKIAECIKALNDEKWKQAITLAKQVGAGGKVGAAKSIAMTRTLGAFLTDVFDKKCPDSSDLYTRKLYKELYKLSGGNETLWNTLFVPKANSLETITFA